MPTLLGCTPLFMATLVGLVGWGIGAIAERAAVDFSEMGGSAVLAVGVSLGASIVGDHINVATGGMWGIALAVPATSGLLITRWSTRSPFRGYAVGAVATGVAHFLVVQSLTLVTVVDPTSLGSAQLRWVPWTTLAVALVTWSSAWLADQGLQRSLLVVLASTALVGSVVGMAVASASGVRSGLLALAGWVGLWTGLNAAMFSVVWLPGLEAGVLGRRSIESETFVDATASFGAVIWLLPATALALVCAAGWTAQQLDTPSDVLRRARDLAFATVVIVPTATALASPRFVPSGSERAELHLGVLWDPLAAGLIFVMLLACYLVPATVAATRRDESWPREIGRGVRSWLQSAPTKGGPTSAPGIVTQPAAPAAPESWQGHLAGANPIAHVPPARGQSPFEDAGPPPLSGRWASVPPAPGEVTPATAPPAPAMLVSEPMAAPDLDAWRTAPPPIGPNFQPATESADGQAES
jgi:hypothetical protein